MSKTLSAEAAATAIRCIDSSIDAGKDSSTVEQLAPLFNARQELSAFTEQENGTKKPRSSGGARKRGLPAWEERTEA